eukprot:g13041.t1
MPVNIKNPAIKRIHADVRELMKDPSDQYHAAPFESNLFEWHFTIRGPPDTEFEGGVYHGRIILPPEYPFRPPDIMFMTPNGRFSTGMKICLTISSYHPEHWQPAWGIRLILEALISFFPSPSQGALGGLDWSPEERKRLAIESRTWKCYKCGLASDLLPELRPKGSGGGGGASSSYADQIRELHKLKAKTAEEVTAESPAPPAADAGAASAAAGAGGDPGTAINTSDGGAETTVNAESSGVRGGAGSTGRAAAAPPPPATVVAPSSPRLRSAGGAPAEGGRDSTAKHPSGDGDPACTGEGTGSGGVGSREQQRQQEASLADNPEREDDLLSFFAVVIALAIVGILIRKIYRFVA